MMKNGDNYENDKDEDDDEEESDIGMESPLKLLNTKSKEILEEIENARDCLRKRKRPDSPRNTNIENDDHHRSLIVSAINRLLLHEDRNEMSSPNRKKVRRRRMSSSNSRGMTSTSSAQILVGGILDVVEPFLEEQSWQQQQQGHFEAGIQSTNLNSKTNAASESKKKKKEEAEKESIRKRGLSWAEAALCHHVLRPSTQTSIPELDALLAATIKQKSPNDNDNDNNNKSVSSSSQEIMLNGEMCLISLLQQSLHSMEREFRFHGTFQKKDDDLLLTNEEDDDNVQSLETQLANSIQRRLNGCIQRFHQTTSFTSIRHQTEYHNRHHHGKLHTTLSMLPNFNTGNPVMPPTPPEEKHAGNNNQQTIQKDQTQFSFHPDDWTHRISDDANDNKIDNQHSINQQTEQMTKTIYPFLGQVRHFLQTHKEK